MKVRLLTDDFVVVVNFERQLAARDARIADLEESSAILNKVLVSITRRHCALQKEIDSTRAAIT